jgi:hypothetical protein
MVSESYLDFAGAAPFIYPRCLEQELTPAGLADGILGSVLGNAFSASAKLCFVQGSGVWG